MNSNETNATTGDNIIDLKTVQTNSIKNLFESLKEILTDVNIEFSKQV